MKVRALSAPGLTLTLALATASVHGAAGGGQTGRAGTQRVNPQAAAVAEFQQRTADYVALRKKVEASGPPLRAEPTPELIVANQRELARRIGVARSTARPGDVFTPAVRPVLRGVLSDLFATPEGASLRATLAEDQPVAWTVRINTRYPDGQPVSTVPLAILKALPPLPQELEYRFAGARLLLIDTRTDVIVDYMDEAIPKGGAS